MCRSRATTPSSSASTKIKALAHKAARPRTSVGRPGRRRRRRVHRHLHRRREGQGPPRRRRQEGHHLRARQGRGHHHRDGRQRRQVRRQPEHHLQRVVHHQLPRPDGQGPQRRVRHRQWSDDHDPRLHAGSEPAGRSAQRSASRPRRRAEHRPHRHRCRQGHRPGYARTARASSTATHCGCRSPRARSPT